MTAGDRLFELESMSSIPEASGMASKKKEVVLVTGGTGYIASHVIEQLVKAGYAGKWGL